MEFSTTYLPVWMQRAMSASGPTRVNFPDSGYVSVFPDQGIYDSDILDWASPSILMSEVPEFIPLQGGTLGQHGQPLIGLQWTLMLQHLGQLKRGPQDYPFQFSLVRLVSWPSLTHLPQDVQPAVARLCALLARKPSAASLLPLLLELPEAQVFTLIEAMRLLGHVHVASSAAEPDNAARSPGESAETASPVPSTTLSLIANIWQRLLH